MKLKRKLKRFFNLVEVSLALGVTAVGVVGVMTILPYALKTAQTTSFDTYLADSAALLFAEMDRLVQQPVLLKKIERNGVLSNEDKKFLMDEFCAVLKSKGDGDSEEDRLLDEDVLKNDLFLKGRTDSNGNPNEFKKLNFSYIGEDLYCLYDSKEGGCITINENRDKLLFFKKNPDDYDDRDKVSPPVAIVGFRIFVTPVEIDLADRFDAIKAYGSGGVQNKETIGYDSHGNQIRFNREIPMGVVPYDYTQSEGNTFTDKIKFSDGSTAPRSEKELWRRVYVELSWPGYLPYGRRTKKFFVKEYYYTDY